MDTTSARLLATLLGVCTALSFGVFLAAGESSGPGSAASAFIAILSYSAVGALVVGRQPRNGLAWIFVAAPFFIGVSCLAQALFDHVSAGSTAHVVFGLIADTGWILALGLPACFLGLLMPDGHLPSPRWRPVGWIAGAALVIAVIGQALGETKVADEVQNPLHVQAAEVLLLPATAAVLLCLIGAGLCAMVVRYRRGSLVERLQMRWIFAAFVAIIALGILGSRLPVPEGIWFASWGLLPAAFAVAISRYKLYEIDVIIRRTLVYAVLIVALGAIYLASIALLGGALQSLTGQSGVTAITLSTLAVAVAFQPLRTRIQRGVDRRFYRRSYDAALTLETFAGTLRGEIGLGRLEDEFLGAAVRAVEPRHASLWLRDLG